MEQFNYYLWLGIIVLQVVLAVKFAWMGLHLRYKAFFCWVCFQAARNAVLELLGEGTVRFFWFWFFTEPILVLTFVITVFELYALALQRFRGIRTVSTRLLTLAIVIASLISVFSILPDLQFNASGGNEWFLLTNVIRRGIYTSLLAFLILLVSFITIFPITLSRNSIVHVALFSTVFLCNAATILAMNFQGPDVVPLVNSVSAVVSIIAFTFWIALITPAGETVERAVRSGVSSDEAAVLLEKLRQVNDTLSASRKRL